ncbi:SAM-dependent methyltransferase [Candidatus Falkowbacteria bacterium CG10_big_fil_rev_8_21_14_0_10_43_10]|uniref:SAM-dependent methyltransferase n=1 Tax=Candidatus Falkowbacteria bacterium CG10_big_fil_rev_8_21_14_0_10_43_10 TaxID=1974567 RepID=A0A2H0V3R2_9BACT|nr:MAG: SAM-dependent methyltransferase [Candidatus Falkowbacteria bacterium CG10_big_fil_rev_8_21_14_0_10_43_10]
MSFAYRVSAYNRQKKWQKFINIMRPGSKTTILDAGFSDREYGPVDNFLEKNYLYPQKITALGIDRPREFIKNYPLVKAICYGGHKFPFTDKSFDIIWSNAVWEHIIGRESQLNFLREIKRVGCKAFITTPNRFFPVEVHTRLPLLHYLPKKVFDKILRWLGKPWAAGGYMDPLSLKEVKELLARAEIKNYQIIKNKLFGLTLDYIIIF